MQITKWRKGVYRPDFLSMYGVVKANILIMMIYQFLDDDVSKAVGFGLMVAAILSTISLGTREKKQRYKLN